MTNQYPAELVLPPSAPLQETSAKILKTVFERLLQLSKERLELISQQNAQSTYQGGSIAQVPS